MEEVKDIILNPYLQVISNMKEVYIFGAKDMGKTVYSYLDSAGIKTKAFIDNDLNKQSQKILNLPVIGLNKIEDKNAIIIVATLNYAYEVQNQAKNLGFKNLIFYPILSIFNKILFPEDKLFFNMLEDLLENKLKYIEVFKRLFDEKSKEVFDKIVDFRLTMNLEKISMISDVVNNQYFDKVINFSYDEVFIDGGAYTGDTSIRFIEKVKNYRKIFLFEPDEEIMCIAKQQLKNFKNIEFISKGLFNKNDILMFNSTGNTGGNINEKGNIKIEVDCIDNIIKEDITFLKLDIEGAEIEAIQGAKNHIINDKPKMAICIYHKPMHIWRILLEINEIRNDYKFLIRHYTNSPFETVLYCL